MSLTVWSRPSPIGSLALATDETGVVVAVEFEGDAGRLHRRLAGTRPEARVAAGLAHPRVEAPLEAYFAGDRDALSRIAWRIDGEGFSERIWRLLAGIPAGSTISYGEMARQAGEPGGAQAAGMALNRNPIPLILPCHRVIGANGNLVGFGGGVERKRWLLAHEGALLI